MEGQQSAPHWELVGTEKVLSAATSFTGCKPTLFEVPRVAQIVHEVSKSTAERSKSVCQEQNTRTLWVHRIANESRRGGIFFSVYLFFVGSDKRERKNADVTSSAANVLF